MVKRVQRSQLFRGFSSLNYNRNTLYDIDIVKRDILNHFYTRKGERVMYPEFGSIVWDMLFEPFTDGNRDLIIEDVKEIIALDTRVELQNLIVDDFEHGIVIEVEVKYIPFDVVDTFAISFDRRTIPSGTINDSNISDGAT